jgi:hypothetical protein
VKRKIGLTLAAMILAISGFGCGNPFIANFFAPLGDSTSLQGTVSLTFVNDTNYQVTTYWGIYNPLDLTENVGAQKLVLNKGASSDGFTLPCTRQIDVAGSDLRYVVKESGITEVNYANIPDETKFSTVVSNTETEEGTAPAAQFHIGVDFDCGDTIEIHFKQDAATQAFSVEMVVVTEEE